MFSGGACSAFGVNSEYTTEGTEKGKERSYTNRRTNVQNEFDMLNVSSTGPTNTEAEEHTDNAEPPEDGRSPPQAS